MLTIDSKKHKLDVDRLIFMCHELFNKGNIEVEGLKWDVAKSNVTQILKYDKEADDIAKSICKNFGIETSEDSNKSDTSIDYQIGLLSNSDAIGLNRTILIARRADASYVYDLLIVPLNLFKDENGNAADIVVRAKSAVSLEDVIDRIKKRGLSHRNNLLDYDEIKGYSPYSDRINDYNYLIGTIMFLLEYDKKHDHPLNCLECKYNILFPPQYNDHIKLRCTCFSPVQSRVVVRFHKDANRKNVKEGYVKRPKWCPHKNK